MFLDAVIKLLTVKLNMLKDNINEMKVSNIQIPTTHSGSGGTVPAESLK